MNDRSCVFSHFEGDIEQTFEISQKQKMQIRSVSNNWSGANKLGKVYLFIITLQSVLWSENGCIGNITHGCNKQWKK